MRMAARRSLVDASLAATHEVHAGILLSQSLVVARRSLTDWAAALSLCNTHDSHAAAARRFPIRAAARRNRCIENMLAIHVFQAGIRGSRIRDPARVSLATCAAAALQAAHHEFHAGDMRRLVMRTAAADRLSNVLTAATHTWNMGIRGSRSRAPARRRT